MKRQRGKHTFWLCALFALLCVCAGVLPVMADNSEKVVDMADLLEPKEEEKLQEQFAGIAEKYDCDVTVVTTNSCGGKSPQDYTDDYYEAHDYGYGENLDGIMLMVSMGERQFHLATRGRAIQVFTDYGLEQIDNRISNYLTDAEYYKAFKTFGGMAEDYLEEAQADRPYDIDHTYRAPMSVGTRVLIALGVSVPLTVIVLAVLFHQLRTVRVKNEARDYIRDGSFHLTRQRDIFLYRTVSRMKIERPKPGGGAGGGGSMTHTTSSGGTAGGRTGSF